MDVEGSPFVELETLLSASGGKGCVGKTVVIIVDTTVQVKRFLLLSGVYPWAKALNRGRRGSLVFSLCMANEMDTLRAHGELWRIDGRDECFQR